MIRQEKKGSDDESQRLNETGIHGLSLSPVGLRDESPLGLQEIMKESNWTLWCFCSDSDSETQKGDWVCQLGFWHTATSLTGLRH